MDSQVASGSEVDYIGSDEVIEAEVVSEAVISPSNKSVEKYEPTPISYGKKALEYLYTSDLKLFNSFLVDQDKVKSMDVVVDHLEDRVKDLDKVGKLSSAEQFALYRMLKGDKLKFYELQLKLRMSVIDTVEAFAAIEKMRMDYEKEQVKEKTEEEGEDKATVKMIRSMLLDSLRKRHRISKQGG